MNIRFSPAPRAAPSAAAPRPVVRDGAARCFRDRYARLARIAVRLRVDARWRSPKVGALAD